ncbi:ABC transporter permease subunit [Phytoactinopolyspora alkaliphila]|uniref:ABC transporter permease subunit n=1 Tax=Phytoactinopolyspora alkaliphila TaxID=1783498 RepID=A0A6N9YTT6_9ACTN|nr:ABC transporter permease subunit [Phytoactinopolyspora alkaliphila]NED98461.1 ABC transporter permease subunit [Phytoactinopolyspora alkaliphila]
MINALRYESVRIRTLRSTYWLLGLGLLLTAAVAFIISFAERDNPVTDSQVVSVLTGGGEFAAFIPIFMAIVGIFSTGHEYRHGTIQPTLTAIPQRTILLLSKLITVLVTTVIVVALSVGINLVIGMLFWDEAPDFGSSPLIDVLPGYLVLVMIYATLGLALAQLFRGVPSALVVLMVVPFLVEPLIGGLSMVDALDWLQPLLKFLPFSAGQRLIATEPYEPGGGPDFDFYGQWASGGVFAAFAVVLLLVAWALFKKRDA